MTPDPTSRPANRAPRGLARFIAGLALAAVTAACGSSDDGATPGPTAAPTSAVTATPDVTEGSVDPTASPDLTKMTPQADTDPIWSHRRDIHLAHPANRCARPSCAHQKQRGPGAGTATRPQYRRMVE